MALEASNIRTKKKNVERQVDKRWKMKKALPTTSQTNLHFGFFTCRASGNDQGSAAFWGCHPFGREVRGHCDLEEYPGEAESSQSLYSERLQDIRWSFCFGDDVEKSSRLQAAGGSREAASCSTSAFLLLRFTVASSTYVSQL